MDHLHLILAGVVAFLTGGIIYMNRLLNEQSRHIELLRTSKAAEVYIVLVNESKTMTFDAVLDSDILDERN